MDSTHPLCILCGAKIPFRSVKFSWQRNFRAIRCDQNEKPFLTGVGSYVPPTIPGCAAPVSPEQRWDDEGFVLSVEDSFPPLIGQRTCPMPGFVFHEACWELLQINLRPHSVPIERLYDLCLSCPADTKGWLDWGHNYGGLMDRVPMDGYPWEDVRIAGLIKRCLGKQNSPLSMITSNPLDVPEIPQALVDSQNRQESTAETDTILPVFRGAADCFQDLPQEVLEYIQALIPAQSVVNVRLASRSFASLPLSQFFWASRFASCQERGFCFEAKDPSCSGIHEQRTRDWKVLYEKTAVTSTSSHELRNRKRIWDCLRDLADLLLEMPLSDEGLLRELQVSPEEPSKTWRTVGGDFAARPVDQIPCGMRCRAIYGQVISTSDPIISIGVSFRKFSGIKYISGLRFIFAKGKHVKLGYILPSKEIYLDFGDGCFNLAGFITAVGPRGITAIRAVTDKGDVSDWVGSPEGLPQTVRLCMKKVVHSVKACFDGFKMVSLAVPMNLEPLFPYNPRSEHLSLRTTGLWYPSLPPPSYHLHDDTFAGRQVSSREYRPLVHVMFGGIRGNLLKYLTRISVTVSKTTIVGIDFIYTPDAPTPIKCLQACPSTATRDDSVKITHPIDGPGGERLTNFQGDGDFFLSSSTYDSYNNYTAISSLKVTTNTNPRPFTFQPSAIPHLKIPAGPYRLQKSRKTEIVPGTTLTGIYFMHDPKLGMISIGPISEDLGGDGGLQDVGIEEEIRAQMPS